MSRQQYDDDDGRVIADMSGIDRQPMLMPDLSHRDEERGGSGLRDLDRAARDSAREQDPVHLDKEGRRAAIGGVLSAYLLVGGILFAAFAALILIIGHLR